MIRHIFFFFSHAYIMKTHPSLWITQRSIIERNSIIITTNIFQHRYLIDICSEILCHPNSTLILTQHDSKSSFRHKGNQQTESDRNGFLSQAQISTFPFLNVNTKQKSVCSNSILQLISNIQYISVGKPRPWSSPVPENGATLLTLML